MKRSRRTWLILDCHYLAYRAYYALGPLSTTKGDRSEILFSFMREICDLRERFGTMRFVFCFDQGYEKRTAIYPAYKRNRYKELTEVEYDNLRAFKKQIFRLRTCYLPELGFRNILNKKGYEADDVIATVCQSLHPKRDKGIIVGADKDFYQLIDKHIFLWNPQTKEPMNLKYFRKLYGIEPSEWPMVLALAGGHDNIHGIKGVGETTAIRYVRGELMHHSKAYKAIQEESATVERNLQLVRLPFDDSIEIRLRDDRLNRKSWDRLIERYEMKSLRKRMKESANGRFEDGR